MTCKREKLFLSYVTNGEVIRSRMDGLLSLRKRRIEEFINQKRFQNEDHYEMEIEDIENTTNAPETDLSTFYHSLNQEQARKECMDEYLACLNQSDTKCVLKAVYYIRKLLVSKTDPPILELVNKGGVVKLVDLLKKRVDGFLLYEVLWCITNIASGDCDSTKYLTENGIIPEIKFLLLNIKTPCIIDQVIWIIANIAGDEHMYRAEMLGLGFLDELVKIFNDTEYTKFKEDCMWAISNLIKGVKKLTPHVTLNQLVKSCSSVILYYHRKGLPKDSNYLNHALSVLTELTEYNHYLLFTLVQKKVFPALNNLLLEGVVQYDQIKINMLITLRLIGNFAAADDSLTCEIVKNGILVTIKTLLMELTSGVVRKECGWILSNIAAGLRDHVKEMLDTPGLVQIMLHIAGKDNKYEVRKESLWGILNLSSIDDKKYIKDLVFKYDLLSLIENNISSQDFKITAICLEGLDNILHYSSKLSEKFFEKILLKVEETDLFAKVDQLLEHPNKIIYNKADRLLQRFFSLEDGGKNDSEERNNKENENSMDNSSEELSNPNEVIDDDVTMG